jgi:hypothetical protein
MRTKLRQLARLMRTGDDRDPLKAYEEMVRPIEAMYPAR